MFQYFLITLHFFPADSGLVLKAIHLRREHGQSQEVTLEQLQVFQVQQKHNAISVSGIFARLNPFIIILCTLQIKLLFPIYEYLFEPFKQPLMSIHFLVA